MISIHEKLWFINIKFSLTPAVLHKLTINTSSKCFFGFTGQDNSQLSYSTDHTRWTTSRYCMLPGPRHPAMLEAVCNFKTLTFHNTLLSPLVYWSFCKVDHWVLLQILRDNRGSYLNWTALHITWKCLPDPMLSINIVTEKATYTYTHQHIAHTCMFPI